MVQALEKMEIEVSPIDFTDLKSNMIITEEEIRVKESLILELGAKYVKEKKANELAELIKSVRPFLEQVSKAKAAKLVKSLIDMFLELEAGTSVSIQLCKECVDWATAENRTFLRQFLQARLISSYYESALFVEALDLCASVLKELKKIDEKHLLVEVLLLESKSYHALNNLSKARASLTSARTTANSIYCSPTLQAYLDLQSGVLHAADEVDFKTAYSYFYEAFECFDSTEHKRSIVALKYMLLSKIMLGLPEDVNQIVSGGKIALKYDGRDIDAMKNIAKASKKRSLADFKETLSSYKVELEDDPIVRAHLDTLYNNLLELNLCKIIEPYSRVEIEFVAKQIELPEAQVEKKLAHMLLDDKFSGILDQSERILVVYEENVPDKTYEAALETINSMSKVVDTLYEKAKKLN